MARCMSGRQIDLLDFDSRHLDSPRIGALVEDLLELLVEALPLRQEMV